MSDQPYTPEQLADEANVLSLAVSAVNDLWRAGVLTLVERDALAVRLFGALDRIKAAMPAAADAAMLREAEEAAQLLLPLDEPREPDEDFPLTGYTAGGRP